MTEVEDWTRTAVETVLRRAHPAEVSPEDLQNELSPVLDTDDIRTGLKTLEEAGLLNTEGEGYALNLPGDPPDRIPDPRRDPEDAEEPDVDEEEAALEQERRRETAAAAHVLPTGDGPSYRASYTLSVAIGGTRGENRDRVAAETAQELEEAIADAIGAHLGLGVSVSLEVLDAYDSPRPVPLPGRGEEEPGS